MIKYPKWFKFKTGFMFIDPEGDHCILLGEGGYRGAKMVPLMAEESHIGMVAQLQFHMNCLVMAYFYKKEWHLTDLRKPDYNQAWWDNIKPMEK